MSDTNVKMEIINSEKYKRANIRFTGIPDEKIREELKREGWFYSRNHNVWYPKNDAADNSQNFAHYIQQTYFNIQQGYVEIISENTKAVTPPTNELLKEELKFVLNEKAQKLETVEYSRENYDKLFPFGIIETPVETVKLGERQFSKLELKDRERLLFAAYQTLKTPDIVFNEERENADSKEIEKSHNYVKSFIFDTNTKAIQDIVVSIDGKNISISSHPREINNVVNKIKNPDQLIFISVEIGNLLKQRELINNEQVIVEPTMEKLIHPLNEKYNENEVLSISDFVVAVGVAPTIQTLRTRASSTALRASTTTVDSNISQTKEKPTELTPEDIELCKKVIPPAQFKFTMELTEGEEGEFFKNKMKEIADTYRKINTDSELTNEDGTHNIGFRYFLGNTEIFLSEIDSDGIGFGYNILNGDLQMSEWGYTSLEEIMKIPYIEMDYHVPEGITIERMLYQEHPEYFAEYAPKEEKKISKTELGFNNEEFEQENVIGKEASFRYELLSRMQQDCEYYLGNGNRNPKHLWALEEVEHIKNMVSLYNSFSFEDKPEWLTIEQLDNFSKELTGKSLEEHGWMDTINENNVFQELSLGKNNADSYTNEILDKIRAAGIEVVTDKDEFDRILEREDILQKMTNDEIIKNVAKQRDDAIEEKNRINTKKLENYKAGVANSNEIESKIQIQNVNITDNEKEILSVALKETAEKFVSVVYSRENYKKIFGDGVIESPIETIKLGSNQFVKLSPGNRNNFMYAIRQTLENPSIILGKETWDNNSETFKPVHLYGKSFVNYNNSEKLVESLIIFKEGNNIAVSLHPNGIDKFVEQIKTTNDIVYLDDEVSRVAAFAITDGDSHVVKENENFLSRVRQVSYSSLGQESYPLINKNYNRDSLLSSEEFISSKGIETGKLEITKDNFDRYFNILNQHDAFKDKRNKIASELFNFHVSSENKDEMNKWLEEQGYTITEKEVTQYMKNDNGLTYGFVHNGKIYLNPDFMNSNAAVHEYTHLWDAYTQKTNPELWNKGLELFKDTQYWNEVISDPNYQDIKNDENLILSEIHSRICGDIAEKVLKRIAELDGEQVKLDAIDWNKKVYFYIREEFELDDRYKSLNFGAENTTVFLTEFLSTPMKDLMASKNINVSKELSWEELAAMFQEQDSSTLGDFKTTKETVQKEETFETEKEYKDEVVLRRLDDILDFHAYNNDGTDVADENGNPYSDKVLEEKYFILEQISEGIVDGKITSLDNAQIMLNEKLLNSELYKEVSKNLKKEAELNRPAEPLKVYTFSPFGYEGTIVQVETDLRRGIPAYDIVGIADSAVKETRERIRTAFGNSGLEMPAERILQALSPADLRKDSPMDLAMAVGILNEQNNWTGEPVLALGELELSGRIRPVRGAVAAVNSAKAVGITNIVCDPTTAELLKNIEGINILSAETLKDVHESLQKENTFQKTEPEIVNSETVQFNEEWMEDYKEALENLPMQGHFETIRAIEIAVAGKHNILATGAPGCGKTLLTQTLIPALTPKMTEEESKQISRINSLAGLDSPKRDKLVPPFRMPHQTATIEGICGGGPNCRPGEISLAHQGTLFMDETAEFRSSVIQMLRVPLESRQITLSRAGRSTSYPADFQLAMAMNPCPCGCYGSHDKICLDSARSIELYWKKISDPLLDRVEIKTFVEKDSSDTRKISIEQMKTAIARAYEIQRKRGVYNSHLTPAEISKYCTLDAQGLDFMEKQLELTPRGKTNLLKTALTIANMDGREQIQIQDLKEARELTSQIFGKPRKFTLTQEEIDQTHSVHEDVAEYNVERFAVSPKEVGEVELQYESAKLTFKGPLQTIAEPILTIDFSRNNFNKLFPEGKIETPIESVKFGSGQFEKFEVRERRNLLGAVYETLKAPHIIIEEDRFNEFNELQKSHNYAKSFIFDTKSKAIQSVVVSIEEEKVIITSHERPINEIVNKIKRAEQILYIAPELSSMIEHQNKMVVNPTFAEVKNKTSVMNESYYTNPYKSIKNRLDENQLSTNEVIRYDQLVNSEMINKLNLYLEHNNLPRITEQLTGEDLKNKLANILNIPESHSKKREKSSMEIINRAGLIIEDKSEYNLRIERSNVVESPLANYITRHQAKWAKKEMQQPEFNFNDPGVNQEVISAAEKERDRILEPVLNGERTGMYKAFKDFEDKGVFDIQGATVKTSKKGGLTPTGWKQLQAAMEIYRSKKFETFRYIIINEKTGEIADQLAITSHMPNFCNVSKPNDETLKQVISRLEELGDDYKLAVCHNHPSGNTTESSFDRELTDSLDRSLRRNDGTNKFLGHIILDHDTFNLAVPSEARPGNCHWKKMETMQVTEIDRFTAEPKPEWAGKYVGGTTALKEVAKKINDTENWNDDFIPVVFTNADRNISGVQYYSKNFFENESDKIRNEFQFAAMEAGAIGAFPVITDPLWEKLGNGATDFEAVMKAHVINDAFTDVAFNHTTMTEKYDIVAGRNYYSFYRDQSDKKIDVAATWEPEVNPRLFPPEGVGENETNWGGKREGAGRPATGAKTKSFTVTLDRELVQRLDMIAAEKGISVNKVLKNLIIEGQYLTSDKAEIVREKVNLEQQNEKLNSLLYKKAVLDINGEKVPANEGLIKAFGIQVIKNRELEAEIKDITSRTVQEKATDYNSNDFEFERD